jgi:prolipoprotein diacylglyceryltransferase
VIPYYPQPVLHLGPFQIHAFGALAALAVLVGGRAILIRAHRKGIPVEQMFRFCFWVYLSAMLGAVLSKTVMSDFSGFLAHPLQAFRLNAGVRSVGVAVSWAPCPGASITGFPCTKPCAAWISSPMLCPWDG